MLSKEARTRYLRIPHQRKAVKWEGEILCWYSIKAGDHSLDIFDSETLDQPMKAIEAEMKKAKLSVATLETHIFSL